MENNPSNRVEGEGMGAPRPVVGEGDVVAGLMPTYSLVSV